MDDLLDGMYQEWVLRERERFRQIYVDSLTSLMHFYQRKHSHERTLDFGRRILALEPLREDVHRAVIEAYWNCGQRAKALQHYETCCTVLADELGITPMEETQALFRTIAQNGPDGPTETSSTGDLARSSVSSMDQALLQLTLAMKALEQAQAQVQQAMAVVRQFVQAQNN